MFSHLVTLSVKVGEGGDGNLKSHGNIFGTNGSSQRSPVPSRRTIRLTSLWENVRLVSTGHPSDPTPPSLRLLIPPSFFPPSHYYIAHLVSEILSCLDRSLKSRCGDIGSRTIPCEDIVSPIRSNTASLFVETLDSPNFTGSN